MRVTSPFLHQRIPCFLRPNLLDAKALFSFAVIFVKLNMIPTVLFLFRIRTRWKSAIVYGYVFVSSPPHLFMVRSSRCSKSPRASTTVRFTSSHRRKYARTPLFEIVGVTLLH